MTQTEHGLDAMPKTDERNSFNAMSIATRDCQVQSSWRVGWDEPLICVKSSSSFFWRTEDADGDEHSVSSLANLAPTRLKEYTTTSIASAAHNVEALGELGNELRRVTKPHAPA